MDIDELNRDVVANSNAIYSSQASKHGAGTLAVLCDRSTRLHQRFAEITKFIPLDSARSATLEVGCGHGEFFKYLAAHGYRGRYVGTDINAELLALARRRFKAIDVREIDILTTDLGERFDYVVLSGVFNIACGQTIDWVHRFLERMYEHAEQAIVFNAVSTYVNYRQPEMFYIDPVEMLRFCIEKLSRRVSLTHHNLSFNYTVCVYKHEEPGLSCEE